MRKSKGFTLVELLIVVAILALLMGMLLPTLQKALKIAEDAVCKANLSSIQRALDLYARDHEGYMPTNCKPDDGTYYFETWNQMLTTGYGPNKYGWMPTSSYIPKGAFECASYEYNLTRRGSYGMNWAMGNYHGEADFTRYYWPHVEYKLSATLRPGKMYLVGDTSRRLPYGHDYSFCRGATWCNVTWRHLAAHPKGHCNVMFHDGHVEALLDRDIPTHGPWQKYLPWWNGEETQW